MAVTRGDRVRTAVRSSATVWRGVAVAVLAAVVATIVARFVPFAGAIIVAVIGGIAVRPLLPDRLRPGLSWSARSLLRLGVVLLGFQLSVADVLTLGAPTLLAVVLTVVAGLVVTMAAGAAMGVPRSTTLLVATGCSICGASAVAAMGGTIRARSEEVTVAIAIVTLFGTGAIFVVPWLAGLLGLTDPMLGAWAGISVHEVAQVVAASAPAGAAALTVAVVVKLTRVVLLAPIVAVAAVDARRRGTVTGATTRPPLIPLFVLLFAAAVAARSVGLVPDVVVDVTPPVTTFLLTAALFALGTAVDPRTLFREGRRTLALGAVASVTVAAVGLGLLTLTGSM